MEASKTSARWAQVAIVLGVVAFIGSAVTLLMGNRQFHVWLTLGGSASTILATRSLLSARASSG